MNTGPKNARPAYGRFALVLIALVAAVTVAVPLLMLRGGHHPATMSAWLTLPVLLFIAAIASAAFRLLWNPMLAAYPPRPPTEDAIKRRYQSFGMGIVNMGGSIHVAADADYLHMTPLWLWRILGARSASIPWSAMRPVGPIGRYGRTVMVGTHRLVGPNWCMSLASPPPEPDENHA